MKELYGMFMKMENQDDVHSGADTQEIDDDADQEVHNTTKLNDDLQEIVNKKNSKKINKININKEDIPYLENTNSRMAGTQYMLSENEQ